MDRVFFIYFLGSILYITLFGFRSLFDRIIWHDVHVSSIETFTQKLLFDGHKNAQFRFSMHFLFFMCRISLWSHNRLDKYHYHTMDTFLFFFSSSFFLFCQILGLVFISFSLYFENFIAECATKYSSSATIYILTSANRLQYPPSFMHYVKLSTFHFSSLSLPGFLLQWHSKSYKNIMKTMFGARCEYRKGKHLVNYKIESHFIMRFAFNTNRSHFDGYLVFAFRQPLWSIWLSSQYTIDYRL